MFTRNSKLIYFCGNYFNLILYETYTPNPNTSFAFRFFINHTLGTHTDHLLVNSIIYEVKQNKSGRLPCLVVFVLYLIVWLSQSYETNLFKTLS
jgi:hypothetical protein